MAIGDPSLNAGIGVYDPNKNYFAKPAPRGGGLLGSGELDIQTVPGQSKMDALNALRERLGMQALSDDSAPAFSIAPTGMTKGQAKQQQQVVGEYDIGRKLAALNRPNTMTQITSALQDDPGNIFLDGQSVFTTGDFDITASPLDIETYGSSVQKEPTDSEIEARIEREERGDFGDDGLIKNISTSDSRRADESEAEFNARIEREERGIFDEDTSGAGSGAGSGSGSGSGASSQKSKSGSGTMDLMKSALDSYNDAIGRAPSGAKSMAEYKKEFSEATGIDISGDPDNKAALTAFGLALMQNKAGRGFNVGNMLSAVGAAGEKALPLMAQARKEAREGKIAAGRYALEKASSADAARQKFLVDQSNYLTKRRDTILDAATARMEAIEDREDKQNAAIQLEAIKSGFDRSIKLAELDLKGAKEAAENKVKTTDTTKITDPALQGLEIVMGNRASDGRAVFKFPAQNAASFGTALADVQEGVSGLDEIANNIRKAQQTPGGTSTQKALEFGQGIAASFGFNLNEEPQFDKDGNFTGMASKPKPLTNATVIRDRIISQFKRFLTQETGNGISNVDIKNIERLLGNVDFLGDPNTALKRVEEAKKIFQGKKDKLVTYLDGFSDKTRYINDQEYLDTRKAIDQAIAQAYSLDFGGFQKITDEDTGLEVYKIGG